MKRAVNRQWCLARRPTGLAASSDFEWKEVPVPRPGSGEALVQNKLLSLDPTIFRRRNWEMSCAGSASARWSNPTTRPCKSGHPSTAYLAGTGVMKRAHMEGFLVLDYWDRAAEAIEALAKWHQEGRLKYRVHEIEGLKSAPAAMNMLFEGSNRGKLIVKI